MPYAAASDIEERYGETTYLLSFDRLEDGTVDDGAVTKALAAASSEIDSYLGARYELPLPSTPDVLTQFCCDIAVYRGSDQVGTLTKEKRRRYEDAIKWLVRVADGTVSLGTTESEVEPVQSTTLIGDNERVWTRTKAGGLF